MPTHYVANVSLVLAVPIPMSFRGSKTYGTIKAALAALLSTQLQSQPFRHAGQSILPTNPATTEPRRSLSDLTSSNRCLSGPKVLGEISLKWLEASLQTPWKVDRPSIDTSPSSSVNSSTSSRIWEPTRTEIISTSVSLCLSSKLSALATGAPWRKWAGLWVPVVLTPIQCLAAVKGRRRAVILCTALTFVLVGYTRWLLKQRHALSLFSINVYCIFESSVCFHLTPWLRCQSVSALT